MMQNCLDARPEEKTYNQLNSRRTDYRENKDDYSNFTLNISERLDTEQTFLKERYIENEEARIIADEETNWSANSRKESKQVFPRQPGDCWKFKLLLVRLSKELTAKDLEIIKFLSIDTEDGDNTGSLQNASNLKVFDILCTKNFITYKDLLYLQMLVAVIGKDLLIDMVYNYAKQTENVLHFDPPLKYTVIGDHLTEISVRGGDFHNYTNTELDDVCNRIKGIVAICPNSQTSAPSCNQSRLSISCLEGTKENSRDLLVYETHESSQQTRARIRQYVVFCDTGMQTEIVEEINLQYQHAQGEENERLRRELADAKREISEMNKKLEYMETQNLQFCEDGPVLLSNIPEVTDVIEIKDLNSLVMNKETKDMEYELKSLKNDNAVLNMTVSILSEESKRRLSNYEEATRENKELRIEKTNTEVQMAILQRNFDELEAKLKTRIEKENSLILGLRNELEMTTASLLNAQNDKRLYELTRCLEQIASMSMTVKKVYGNFDPAHEHISPEQDELFRKSLSGKIGRIYPQIYYTTNKR